MPRIQQTFTYDQISTTKSCTFYSYSNYNNTLQAINRNNTGYLEHNQRFFNDLFSLLEETGLLEDSEIIHEVETNKYMQSITIFGCKFQLWLNNNIFCMVKDYLLFTTSETTDSYYIPWVSLGETIYNINNYTITVNYGETYLDVYVDKGSSEQSPLFTLIKCHSANNTYDFVYACKNVNLSGCKQSSSHTFDIYAATDKITSHYNTSSWGNVYSSNGSHHYYHHIYYCDKHQKTTCIYNDVYKYDSKDCYEILHCIQTNCLYMSMQSLFMRYRTHNLFNETFNGIKIMKPIACYFNIVFDDIGEVLWGPNNLNILTPGRDYIINEEEYYCPGTDTVVLHIKNAGEANHQVFCNRWLFKL